MFPQPKRLIGALGLLLFTANLFAGGQLPLRMLVNEVEQAPEVANVRPAYRRIVENAEGLERAIAAQERHTDALLQDAGARGTAVSWDEAGDPVIRVYIDASSSSAGIPTSLDGVPVEVIATGRFYALNMDCSRREADCALQPDTAVVASTSHEPGPAERHPRPVPIGVSTGHYQVTAGTIGCRVKIGCHSYALSNAHVFADENSGVPGDNILQPGKYDGGLNPADKIGELYDSVPIVMTSTALNKVDAAIARVSWLDVGNATPSDGYGTPKTDPVTPAVNLNVMKYGRTSGMSYGYIDALNATVMVTYDAGDARFVGQIVIKPDSGANFSRPGDSGSLVVASGGASERSPVGLLFASGTGLSVANPIAEVLSELGINIDGE